MKRDEQDFLRELHEENLKFYDTELGRAALKDLNKLFPRHWLYIAELLQNALDAGATNIVFDVARGCLVVEHDGQEFSGADVRALCVKGGSTKGVGTIGFMGVGFKSIYQAFDTVDVSSGPWRFRLKVPITRGRLFDNKSRRWVGAMLPEGDDSIPGPSPGMSCRFFLSGRIDGLPPKIEADLQHVVGEDESLLALLAHRGVKRLRLAERTWELSEVCEVPDESLVGSPINCARFRLRSRNLATKSTRQWVLLARKYVPSQGAVKRLLEHRDIDVRPEDEEAVYAAATRPRTVEAFFPLDENGHPDLPERGELFALLPTSINSPFGFHIQADWLLAITRHDLMDLTENPWHEEIRAQVPALVGDYLEWMTTCVPAREAEPQLYRVFPLSQNSEIDRWFTASTVLRAVTKTIAPLRCLPALIDATDQSDEEVSWISPSDARQLPQQLSEQIDRPAALPRSLFGDRVASRRALGGRAIQFLQGIGLWKELAPAELARAWHSGTFKAWWLRLSTDDQRPTLEQLYGGLGALDSIPAWRTTALTCIPTETGAITTRVLARRYPAEWSVLANEPEILAALSSQLGPTESRFPFEMDRAWTQTNSKALAYLKPIASPLLDALIAEWWTSLQSVPDEQGTQLIVRFTDWVRAKQSQRKKAVPFLLCEGPRGIELFPCEEALLADPYASRSRRQLFPETPVVASHYNEQCGASAGEWRVFFLGRETQPKGEFALYLTMDESEPQHINTFLKTPIPVPRIRQRPRLMFDVFTHWRVPYRHVALVDAHIDESLVELVDETKAGIALTEYLTEGIETLRKWSRKLVRFIADSTEAVTDVPSDPARWVAQLTDLAWVPVEGDSALHKPCMVLARRDEARPETPFAVVPEPLVEVLIAAGVPFAREVADAPALTRLRVHGRTASVADLEKWIDEAVASSRESPEVLASLKEILELPIFPLPTEVNTVDGMLRVPYSRFAKRSRPRSDLGGWIVAIDSLHENADLRRLLDKIHVWHPSPAAITLAQVRAYLTWVYRVRPEAEKVRQVLPTAYAYVQEDGSEDDWAALQGDACVFVQRAREWTRVSDGDIHLDDLHDPLLEQETRGLRLATPGHLGETPAARRIVAAKLGVSLVSDRFRVETQFVGVNDAPETWKRAFDSVQAWFRRQESDVPDDGIDDEHATRSDDSAESALSLARHPELRVTVFDRNAAIRTANVNVLATETTIAVRGEPHEFAEELSQLMIHKAGLSRRRDTARLTAQCMGHLLLLNDQEALTRRLGDETQPPVEPPGPGPQIENQPEARDVDYGQNMPREPSEIGSRAAETDGAQREYRGQLDQTSAGDGRPPTQPAATRPLGSPRKPSFTEDTLIAIVRAMFIRLDPATSLDAGADTRDPLESDETPYREAVMRWEEQEGRYPVAKSGTQPGHDIDSYTNPEGHPDRRLIRRIEVKGKGVMWTDQEIVTPSMRQFLDAALQRVEATVSLHPEFDYWLYIVETDERGVRCVLPLKNPARAGKLAVRADLWRRLVEPRAFTGPANDDD